MVHVIIVVHMLYECRKKKFNESKYRRQKCNFVDREAKVNDDLKNLKLFISDVALPTKTDDCNAWFIGSGASIHMTCNRDWFKSLKPIM